MDELILEKSRRKEAVLPTSPKFETPEPILYPEERTHAKEQGFSVDAKLMREEYGLVNQEKMCYCFALAISRHIKFSRGYLFLEDLKGHLEEKSLEEPCLSQDELRFSYQFKSALKIRPENLQFDANSIIKKEETIEKIMMS